MKRSQTIRIVSETPRLIYTRYFPETFETNGCTSDLESVILFELVSSSEGILDAREGGVLLVCHGGVVRTGLSEGSRPGLEVEGLVRNELDWYESRLIFIGKL